MKKELQAKLKVLSDGEYLNRLKAKLGRVGKRRARKLRASKLLQLEEKQRQEHISEKEAAINTWRMKQIHEVEERKKVRLLVITGFEHVVTLGQSNSTTKHIITI